MQGHNQQELNDLLSKCRFEYFVKEIDDSNLQTIKLSYNNKLDGTTLYLHPAPFSRACHCDNLRLVTHCTAAN